MKKFIATLISGLLWCSFGFANPILLECEHKEGNDSFFGDRPPSDTYNFSYYLISSDFKTLYNKEIIENTKILILKLFL